MITPQPPLLTDPPRRGVTAFARRRPIAAFLLGAYGLGWPLLTLTTVTGWARPWS
jgi:hypothetical protein